MSGFSEYVYPCDGDALSGQESDLTAVPGAPPLKPFWDQEPPLKRAPSAYQAAVWALISCSVALLLKMVLTWVLGGRNNPELHLGLFGGVLLMFGSQIVSAWLWNWPWTE